jgi:hypothetical protein
MNGLFPSSAFREELRTWFSGMQHHFERNLLSPSSTLKMEAADSSEMLVPVYQTTQYYIPENYDYDTAVRTSNLR